MKYSGKGKKSHNKSGNKRNFNVKKPVNKTRKDIRKEQRQNKKANKVKSYLNRIKNNHEFHSKGKKNGKSNPKAKNEEVVNNSNVDSVEMKNNTNTKPELTDLSKENKKSKRDQITLEKQMKKQRRLALLEDNRKEDKIISSLEKQLKLNRRKAKTLPSSFTSSGLDYILDVCNPEKMKNLAQTEKYLQDSGSEFEDDLATVTGKESKTKENEKMKKMKDESSSLISSSDEASDYESESSMNGAPVKRKANSDKQKTIKKMKRDSDYSRNLSEEGDDDDDVSENEDDISDDDSLIGDLQGSDSGSDVSDEEDIDESDFAESMDEETEKNTFINSRIGKKPSKINDDGIMESTSESEPDEVPIKKQTGKKRVQLDVPNSDDDIPKGKFVLAPKQESDDESSLENNADDDDVSDDNETPDDDDDKDEGSKKDDETWEDIYGRTRDKDGNVVEARKYVPPALRQAQSGDEKKREALERLRRQMKGLLNRLAESNMHSIATQIEQLYMSNSRNDMNQCIIDLFTDAIVSPVHTPERLIMEHAMLTAILHANIGTEVGAYILQTFVMNFDRLLNMGTDIGDKRLDNLLTFISHLYTFKVFGNSLLYDVLGVLCDRFQEKEIELILVVLRCVGFSLRKDDPIALKDLVLRIQRLAGQASTLQNDARVKFMLDTVLKIKNNNMSKLPQYDPSHSEHLKKLVKSFIRKGNYVTELNISLQDLLKAEERGRWWIVGSAWTGPSNNDTSPDDNKPLSVMPTMSNELTDLAKKLRINTDVRKNIFSVLMTAEDFEEAFEKLHKLGLKGQTMNEIVHVLLHCLLQEKEYNHYYSLIANRFCQTDRRHRMVIQYSLWDKFKEVEQMKPFQLTNLAKFLAFLFIEGTLPLSVLKVIQFVEMTKGNVRLIRQILLSILYTKDEQVAAGVFLRLTKSTKLHLFREGLRLFLHHFLLKNMKESEDEFLKQRIEMADRALQSQAY